MPPQLNEKVLEKVCLCAHCPENYFPKAAFKNSDHEMLFAPGAISFRLLCLQKKLEFFVKKERFSVFPLFHLRSVPLKTYLLFSCWNRAVTRTTDLLENDMQK